MRALAACCVAASACASPESALEVHVAYDTGWALTALRVTIDDRVAELVVDPTLRVLVPDAWIDTPRTVRIDGLVDANVFASGAAIATALAHEQAVVDVTLQANEAAPGAWTEEKIVLSPTLVALWGTTDGYMYAAGAAGSAGVVYFSNGLGAWTPEDTHGASALRTLWGASAEDLYAAGEHVLLHSSGDGLWTEIPSPLDGISTISGAGPGEVYLWGAGGACARGSASSGWKLEDCGARATVYGAWSDGAEVVAVGESATLVTKRLGSWSVRPSPVAGTYAAISGAGRDRFAVTREGDVVRGIEDAWIREPVPERHVLAGVWARAGEAIAVGSDGFVARRAAGVWQVERSTGSGTLRAVWGLATGELYVVAGDGPVLHRR